MLAQLIADSRPVMQMEEPISILAERKSRTWSALDIAERGTLSREEALSAYKVTDEDLTLFEDRWRTLKGL